MVYSVATAKAKLSQLIRDAHKRGEVVITDRGRPVARLIAYRDAEPASLDEHLADLERRGLVIPASDKDRSAPWPVARRRRGALARFLKDRG